MTDGKHFSLHRRSHRTKVGAAVGVLVVIAVGIVVAYLLHPPSPASRQIELPFTGLSMPAGVAVDTAGTVYVTDSGNQQVVKLAAGSSTPTVLPHRPRLPTSASRWTPPATSTSPTTATTGW